MRAIVAKLITGFAMAALFFSCVEGDRSLSPLSENNQKQLLASYEYLGVMGEGVDCEEDGSGCVLQVPADFLGEEGAKEGVEEDQVEQEAMIDLELVCKWKCEKGEEGILFSGPPLAVEDAEMRRWMEKVKEAASGLKEPVVVGIFPGLESALVLDAAEDLGGMRKASNASSLGTNGMLVGQSGSQLSATSMNVVHSVATASRGMTGSLGTGVSVQTQALYVNGLLQERGESFTANLGTTATASGALGGVAGGVTTVGGGTQTTGSVPSTTTEPAPATAGVILYQYDGSNRMVGRHTQEGNRETNTRWDYFGMMKLTEARENRDLGDVEFYHGVRGIEAIRTGRTGEKLYALHKDHLGSTALVTDESTGSGVEWDFYDPYGKPIQKQSSIPTGNPILYTGYAYDPIAEIYLTPYRAYDPDLGRFLQRDWLGTGDGPNEYAYVGNSSLGFVDPLGLSKRDAEEASDPSLNGYLNYLADEELPGYVAGFSHAYVKSTTGYGMENPSWWDPAFNRGESVGYLVGAGQGIVETVTGIVGVIAGAGMTGGGVALVPITGGISAVGVPAGTATMVAGVAGAGHGTWTLKNALEGLRSRPMQSSTKEAGSRSGHADLRAGERNISPETERLIVEKGKIYKDADYPERTIYVLDNKNIPGLEKDPGSRMVVMAKDGTTVTVIHKERVLLRQPIPFERKYGRFQHISEVRSQTNPNRLRYTPAP